MMKFKINDMVEHLTGSIDIVVDVTREIYPNNTEAYFYKLRQAGHTKCFTIESAVAHAQYQKIDKNGKIPELSYSRHKDIMIDRMNKENTVILRPGEVWQPLSVTEEKCPVVKQHEKEKTPEECTYHQWVDVLLFRTTVTECKKCGVLRE